MSTQESFPEELWQNIDHGKGYEELRGLDLAQMESDPDLKDVDAFTAQATATEVGELWNESRSQRFFRRVGDAVVRAMQIKMRYVFAGTLAIGLGVTAYHIAQPDAPDAPPVVSTTTENPCPLLQYPDEDPAAYARRVEACVLNEQIPGNGLAALTQPSPPPN